MMENLKGNLITAAYPRGGAEHLEYHQVLGEKAKNLPDFRAQDSYKSFRSLKSSTDPQIKKIKDMAARFDAPKRVEIKELELSLQ